MSTALAATALLMGLAGGPHCAAMCGVACAGVARAANNRHAVWQFQAGRVAGYAGAGAVAAAAVEGLAWMSSQAVALRPLWTLFHLAVLGWGLLLVARAQQPQWVATAGRAAWARMRPAVGLRGGAFAAGVLWAAMPCGLLYSALLVASLAGGPLQGAAAMALFAAGSGLALGIAPWLFGRLRDGWGTRAAGAMLALAAAWGLWMDMGARIAQWCGVG